MHGLGQLTPQGLNRALALVTMLPKKFGKPDYIYAPDPIQKADGKPGYYYVRPLATVEPLAMPMQTPYGFEQIDKLNAELIEPKYAVSTIFVAWEPCAPRHSGEKSHQGMRWKNSRGARLARRGF